MSQWEDRFHRFLTEFLQSEKPEWGVEKVTGFDDSPGFSGGCPTCSYGVIDLTFYFIDVNGHSQHTILETSMSYLLQGL